MTPATLTSIELAWWEKGRARDVAIRFNCSTSRVERIWFLAHAQQRVPPWPRPKGGFDYTPAEAAFARAFWQLCRSAPFGYGDEIFRALNSPVKARAA